MFQGGQGGGVKERLRPLTQLQQLFQFISWRQYCSPAPRQRESLPVHVPPHTVLPPGFGPFHVQPTPELERRWQPSYVFSTFRQRESLPWHQALQSPPCGW